MWILFISCPLKLSAHLQTCYSASRDRKKSGALGQCLGRTVISGFDVIGDAESAILAGARQKGLNDNASERSQEDKIEYRVATLLESVTLACFRGAARRLYERHKTGYVFACDSLIISVSS